MRLASTLFLSALLISCAPEEPDCTPALWYEDADGDGVGSPSSTTEACAVPVGFVADRGDCDDADASVFPGAAEQCTDTVDRDCDGTPGGADGDGDGAFACVDCDDANPGIHADADERCDGVDNDCDGRIDVEAVDPSVWYRDADHDGRGDPEVTALGCAAPAGFVAEPDDCNDQNADIYAGAPEVDCADPVDYNCDGSVGFADGDHDGFAACLDCDDGSASVSPAATEACNTRDDDCDGLIDEAGATGERTFFPDVDGDTWGADMGALTACTAPPTGFVEVTGDCDDGDAAYHPGAAETCTDPEDFNCDGSVIWADADKDGFAACLDCDDGDATVNTDGLEVCDEVDNDCDGAVDGYASSDAGAWYRDADSDGFGDPDLEVVDCAPPEGYVAATGDCDDLDPAFNPGASETCDDDTDYNCDGATAYADSDDDGFAACDDCDDSDARINDGGTEVCNAVDDDCDGDVDEASALDARAWYLDGDGDGDGDATIAVVACAQPSGYVASAKDCDDGNREVHPDRIELCDGLDNDCDGAVDDDATDAEAFFADVDADGFGAGPAVRACSAPTGFVSDDTDCDDGHADVNPLAVEVCDLADNDCDGATDGPDAADARLWYADADRDGFGDPAETATACAAPVGYLADASDCNDADNAIFPGAAEVCGGVDHDCDGVTDEDTSLDAATWYADDDRDGFGDPSASVPACERPAGYTADFTDCDDATDAVHPGATEVCNDIDDDCDAFIDPATSSDALRFYADADGDTHGGADGVTACAAPEGYVTSLDDCDDLDAARFPGATEVCNDVDDDCDSAKDEGLSQDWYPDLDGDNFGACLGGGAGGCVTISACAAPSGFVNNERDCDDTDAGINPQAVDACDQVDNDCDGAIDEELPTALYYADTDLDGHGADNEPVSACRAPDGYAAVNDDCDDLDETVFPGATEVCNEVDDDCDDAVDEGLEARLFAPDDDGDGHGTDVALATVSACAAPAGYAASFDDCDDLSVNVYPGAVEICDGAQNDCDAVDWTTASEDGVVSMQLMTGQWANVPVSTAPGTVTDLTLTDEMWACGGTYYVRATAAGSTPQRLHGRYGASRTVFDADGSGSALTVTAASRLTVDGITLRSGSAPAGGGAINHGTLSMTNSRITGNVATRGGGLWAGVGAITTLDDTAVDSNSATGTGPDDGGGGLYFAAGSTWTLTGTTVSGNASLASGGGVYAVGAAGNTTVGAMSGLSTVRDNRAATDGGGLYLSGAQVTCTGSTGSVGVGVVGNTSDAGAGGGVFLAGVVGERFEAIDCDFGTGLGDDNFAGTAAEISDLSVSGGTMTWGDDTSAVCMTLEPGEGFCGAL